MAPSPLGSSDTIDPTGAHAAELRSRLAALVAQHGESLSTDADAARACELALSALYAGPTAVRTYAVVQALKSGIVADLLAVRTREALPALAARLTERSGAAPPIAAWALLAWWEAFSLDAEEAARAARAERAARAAAAPPAVRAPDPNARELVVRVPHLVALGAAGALAFAALMATGGPPLPRALRIFGEAAASAPEMPPAPAADGAREKRRGARASDDEPRQAGAPTCAISGRPDRPPRALDRDVLAIPAELADEGISNGTVTLRLTVDATGRVDADAATLVRASHPALEAPARAALAAARWRPARRGGCAAGESMTRVYRFVAADVR